MWLQAIGVVAAVIGFFANIQWLLIAGGVTCVLMDLVGFASGKLKPIFPIILYIGGYVVAGSWIGILYGSVVGNVIEVLFMGGLLVFMSSKRHN